MNFTRFNKGDMIEVYKYLPVPEMTYNVFSGTLNPTHLLTSTSTYMECKLFCTVGQSTKESFASCTNRTQLQIIKETLSLAVDTSVLHFSVTNLWNCLPEEVVSAPSLNTFKGRLDKFLDKCQFSLNSETLSRH